MARHNIFIGPQSAMPDDISDLAVVIVTTDTDFTFIKHDWAGILITTPFPIALFDKVFNHPILWF